MNLKIDHLWYAGQTCIDYWYTEGRDENFFPLNRRMKLIKYKCCIRPQNSDGHVWCVISRSDIRKKKKDNSERGKKNSNI